MIADRAARLVGAGVVIGLGLATFGIHVVHVTQWNETAWSLVFGVLVPLLLSVSVLVAGASMVTDRMEGRLALRVAGWAVGGTVALSAMGVLTVLYQQAVSASLAHPTFVVANLATGGAVAGVLVGLYDAERLSTEDRLTRERQKADRLGQQLAVLNRVLRHDIRNGVNVIAGFAGLVREERRSAAEYAERIERKASELQRMSENAQRIERMIHGDGTIEQVDLVECVETGVERIERDYPALCVEIDLPASEPVTAHPLVQFAIDNVLDNAVEHNDAPDPVVEAALWRETDTEREHVVLEVTDNGPGIPEEELSVLEAGRETQLHHASGLGLWLINWIVTESDGEVSFEDRDPRGSVVTIRLPAVDPSDVA